MTRRTELHDDWDDGFDSADFDAGDDDDEPTVPCPYCGQEIHEDAQRCPHCEQYISEEDAPAARKPWWIVLGVGACLYLVYRWIILTAHCLRSVASRLGRPLWRRHPRPSDGSSIRSSQLWR